MIGHKKSKIDKYINNVYEQKNKERNESNVPYSTFSNTNTATKAGYAQQRKKQKSSLGRMM